MDLRLRRWRRTAAGGDPEARARALRERLRGGDLDLDALRLASLTGDPAAQSALGVEAPPTTWPLGLGVYGGEVVRVALRAGLERALPAACPELRDVLEVLPATPPWPDPSAWHRPLDVLLGIERAGPRHWAVFAVDRALALWTDPDPIALGDGAVVVLDACARAAPRAADPETVARAVAAFALRE